MDYSKDKFQAQLGIKCLEPSLCKKLSWKNSPYLILFKIIKLYNLDYLQKN